MSINTRSSSPSKLTALTSQVRNLDTDLQTQKDVRAERTQLIDNCRVQIDRLTLENRQLSEQAEALDSKLAEQQRENARTAERNEKTMNAMQRELSQSLLDLKNDLLEKIDSERQQREPSRLLIATLSYVLYR